MRDWKKRGSLAVAFVLLLARAITGQRGGVEVFEIGKHNTDQLPAGKEADGIIGDFVLRNDRVEALISGGLPNRRANMSTEYRFTTPGCLYDLDLRGAGNDQLTAFRPGDQGGDLNFVRIVNDSGEFAAVEAVRTAAKGDGLYVRHEYRLEPGWQHILVISTYRNESREAKEIQPAPVWKEFSQRWQTGNIRVGDSIDPADKRAYAWTPLEPMDEKVVLQPGQARTYKVAVAVADSPLAAYGLALGLTASPEEVKGTARDAAPAVNAAILVDVNGQSLPAYPDASGNFAFRLPVGTYRTRLVDLGRESREQTLTVSKGRVARLDYSLDAASAVSFDVRDEAGRPSPCKVQFLGRNATPTPNFGTAYRAHGNDHQYQSHNGKFTQQTPPGDYLIRITRGPEFDLFEKGITVGKGRTVQIAATLKRSVDTTGWISTDYHSHSTPSGDNYCNTNDRIINIAAEHIEFAPTTEHNRIYDWQAHIDRLGLSSQIKTVIGIELTGRGQHFNSFPLDRTPHVQDAGAPVWQQDPRLNAIVLRDLFDGGAGRWVQANHPIVGEVFNDRNRDGVADGGFVGFERLIDAAEVWSTEILNLHPNYEHTYDGRTRKVENRTFGWLQMLNQGRHVWCVAVSDAHRIFGNGVGSWRTYVPSSTDDPAQINYQEIIRHSKAGRMMITNGPFLRVQTADGEPIGSWKIAAGSVNLKVKVQTPNWMDIDRVQVLVNGRQPKEYNFTRAAHPGMFRQGTVKFDEMITIKLQQDAHLIVVATGEGTTLEKGWGRSWEAGMHPLAYTNPIYVDTDGKGFQANGDNLGHPLLVAPVSD